MMRLPARINLHMIAAITAFLAYPVLVYRGMDSGLVWIAPVLVSSLYLFRAFERRDFETRVVNLLIGGILLAGVIFLRSMSAKFLPVLVQLMLCWFFGRTLFKGPPLIERLVRLDYSVFPPGVAEYCERLTWIWTLFFALNALLCSALAVWASDGWWAFYSGVVLVVSTVLLLMGEYFYRRFRFPDFEIPDPKTSIKSILVNGRKIWADVHARQY